MKAGSCATETDEPRQDRKVAAVSHVLRVPQGYLAGVWKEWSSLGVTVEQRCTTLF